MAEGYLSVPECMSWILIDSSITGAVSHVQPLRGWYLSETLHHCCDHCQRNQRDGCNSVCSSGSLASSEGYLLCGYVHELDRLIVADRQFDRHNCQPRLRSTQWIVPSFLTVNNILCCQLVNYSPSGQSTAVPSRALM